ncbi:MAG: hypothetical protein ABH891_08455 [Candidatus Omnitrophota bacterium]
MAQSVLKNNKEVSDQVRLAFQWLQNSGIQIRSQDPQTNGGVCSWFDLERNSYPFIYAEITGYAVNAFLFQHKITGDLSYLTSAVRAGDWLLKNRCSQTGLVRTRHWLDETKAPYYDQYFFTFDQWIIVYGLACLAEVTREPRFHEGATSIAKYLLAKTLRSDGFFYPLYDGAQHRSVEFGDKWSRQAGSFHAKALMALSKLFQITGEPAYRHAAERLLTKTLFAQTPEGRFITQDSDQSTHLHPFLYTLEGLASYALSEGKKEILIAVERAMKWVLDRQNADGSLYCFYQGGSFRPCVRADIMAQVLRMGTILTQQGLLEGSAQSLDKLRGKLETYQVPEGSQTGGFMYGQEENGAVHSHVNAWVTMFASQAMCIHDGLRQTRPSYDMSFFV